MTRIGTAAVGLFGIVVGLFGLFVLQWRRDQRTLAVYTALLSISLLVHMIYGSMNASMVNDDQRVAERSLDAWKSMQEPFQSAFQLMHDCCGFVNATRDGAPGCPTKTSSKILDNNNKNNNNEDDNGSLTTMSSGKNVTCKASIMQDYRDQVQPFVGIFFSWFFFELIALGLTAYYLHTEMIKKRDPSNQVGDFQEMCRNFFVKTPKTDKSDGTVAPVTVMKEQQQPRTYPTSNGNMAYSYSNTPPLHHNTPHQQLSFQSNKPLPSPMPAAAVATHAPHPGFYQPSPAAMHQNLATYQDSVDYYMYADAHYQ